MRHIFFLLVTGSLLANASGQDIRIVKTPSILFNDSVAKGLGFRINGSVEGRDTAIIYFFDNKYAKIDSAVVRNGKFELTGVVNAPGYLNLNLSNSYYFHHLFIESGDLNVLIKESPHTFSVIGGPENTKKNLFSAEVAETYDQLYSFEEMIRQSKKNADINKFILYIDSCRMLEKSYLAIVRRQIDSSNFGYYLLDALNSRMVSYSYFEERLSLFNRLPSQIRDSRLGKEAYSYLIKAKPDADSGSVQKAFSFTLPNKNGRQVSLSSFKGSYLLIDFWASWCIPCLEELPLLKEIYAHHNPAGARFLSISIDKKKTEWLKMERKGIIKWASVLDNKNVSAKYNVEDIPRKILVDPSGNIVATDVSLEKLFRIITELK